MGETRKLAAILVADIVGYSRLASVDEERTLTRIRGLRSDLIDPAIATHHGRVVKRTGDGAIVEFRSVVDAVNCAIQIQRAMAERNAGVALDKRIEFRIGVHLADVVEESDGDLMGDGVNIAARLQGIAEPGGICLSEQGYWQVKGRLDLKVSDLGPTQLKNIAQPIRVYVLDVGQPARTKPALQLIEAETGAHLWAERFDKPIADLFDMQDEIVARLANQLGVELASAEARRSEGSPNPDSLDLYLQGLAWYNKGPSAENFARAATVLIACWQSIPRTSTHWCSWRLRN